MLTRSGFLQVLRLLPILAAAAAPAPAQQAASGENPLAKGGQR